MTLPVDINDSPNYTSDEHADHHNDLHAEYNTPTHTHSGSTALLATKAHAGGSDTAYVVTSTSFADIDATNLVVTFTAPASGNVLVRLCGRAAMDVSALSYWNLRNASGDIAATSGLVTSGTTVSTQSWATVVTGLTPSTSYTWKWGAKVASSQLSHYHGPNWGKLVMEIWSAP